MEKIWLKNYPEGMPAEIDLAATGFRSTVDMLDAAVRSYGDAPAYVFMGTTLSFREFREKVNAMAGYFQSIGLVKGDRVALMMPNVLQYPICLFAAHVAGLVAVPCNPLYTQKELSHQLRDSGVRAIVIVENFAHTLAQALPSVRLDKIIVTKIGDELGLKGMMVNMVVKYVKKMVPDYVLPDVETYSQAMSLGMATTVKPVAIELEDIAFLQYTGGTTGVSKGAVLTHRNIVSNVLQAKTWIGGSLVAGKDMIVTALPLYHIFALTANCLTMMSLGVSNLLILNARDIPAMVKEMQKYPWSIITAVNTLFNGLLQNHAFRALDFSRLKFALGGGMAVQRAVAEDWKSVTGLSICQAYGLSETSPAVTMNPLNLDFNGAIGLPISSTLVTIRDEVGKELGLNEVGEICVQGPQVMREYWNRPEESQRAFFPEHTFRTGDMGKYDEQGFIYIVDRLKDMVLVSGFNVYPNEIEEALVSHPAVKECGVIGIQDEKTGEAVVAYIVRKPANAPGADASTQLPDEDLKVTLREHCKTQLTNYKIPKHFRFIAELPKSNVGKVLRKELRNINANT
jgi:long-chain acyl-CoA synthetase